MKFQHKGNCVLFRFWPDVGEAGGWFDEENQKIYIAKRLNPYQREVLYFHERAHKECFLNGCKCWGRKYLCEYHAMREELKSTILSNNIDLCKAYHENTGTFIERCQEDPEVWKTHMAAFNKIRKTKMYKIFEGKMNEMSSNDNEP